MLIDLYLDTCGLVTKMVKLKRHVLTKDIDVGNRGSSAPSTSSVETVKIIQTVTELILS